MALFIAFEGGEGSGKSTQVKLLAEKMRGLGREVVLTKEPGSEHLPQNIDARKVILTYDLEVLTEVLFFLGDRNEHLAKLVIPALEAGKDVLTDRFDDSTKAYQTRGGKFDYELYRVIRDLVVKREPDIKILLDIDPVVGLARKHSQGEITRMELKKLEFHERVNEGFRDFAAEDPKRWIVVDASSSIEEIHDEIWEQISPRLVVA